MSEAPAYRRGDVVLAVIPFVSDTSQGKARPVVIIQNDVGNRFSPNLIIATISSQIPRRPYPTNVIVRLGSAEATGTGLDRDSVVQTEVIHTVPKSAIVRRLGQFESAVMQAIDRSVKVSLGLT